MTNLKAPEKGFTKAERAWLAEVVKEINTNKAVAGRNTSVTDSDDGQVVNADDCTPCP